MSTEAHCFLCGGRSERVVWREPPFEARACDCGVVYTTPAPPDGDACLDVQHPDAFFALPARAKVRWLREVCPPPARLLEVGCGDGAFLREARRAGYEVAGIEASPERADVARREFGPAIETRWLEEVSGEGGRFDLVWHTDLISHFPDPIAALREMQRLLAPGGIVAFEVGLLTGSMANWRRWNARPGLHVHRWLFDESALSNLLSQAGLSVQDRRDFDLAAQISVQRAMGWLGGRLFGGSARDAQAAGSRPPNPAIPSALRRGAERILVGLRYGVGRVAPRLASQTLWIAARAA